MVTPRTSQKPTPGYVPRSTGGLGTAVQLTNPTWQDAFVKFWADQWARNKTLPQGLDLTKYGYPSTDDYVNSNNEAIISPLTILALSNFARDYKPGMDTTTDAYIPYVAPAPDDYVESPEERTSRIQQEQFAAGQGLSREISQAGLTGGLANTELSRLQGIGNLALSMSQLDQNRANTIAQLSADPGNWIERDYHSRGIAAPPGQRIPLYKDNPVLSQAITDLQGYRPLTLTAPAAAPAPPAAVPAPTPAPAVAPSAAQIAQGPKTPEQQAAAAQAAGGVGSVSNTAAMTNQPGGMVANWLGIDPKTGDYDVDVSTPAGMVTPGPVQYPNSQIVPSTYNGGFGGPVKALADGGSTDEEVYIAGDPQVADKANPELVVIDYDKEQSKVIPLSSYANGTAEPNYNMTQYDESVYNNFPTLNYLRGGMGSRQYNTLSTGYTPGAFNSQLPEAGALNFRNLYDVLQDPIATSMIESLYRSGSRSFTAEASRAKARAPIGRALSTSMIRT